MEQLLSSDLFQQIMELIRSRNVSSLTRSVSSLSLDQLPGADAISNEAIELFQKITTGFFVVGLILCLLGCFFGYKLLKLWIGLTGFLIGAIAGYGITWYFTENVTYSLIATLICAILIAFLSYKIYLLGVFLLAGVGVYFLCTSYLPLTGVLLPIASAAIGLIVAILAVHYMRPAIIVITGLQNGLLAVGALFHLVPTLDQALILPLGVGLGMIGAAFQFLTTKSKKKH
jgi:hypothetical protein